MLRTFLFTIISILFCKFLLIYAEDSSFKKINNLNLLFPLIYDSLDSRTIEHTLTAYNGCYEWHSSKPEYLSVQPSKNIKEICNTQATVLLSTNKPYDNIIWITAKDKGFFENLVFFIYLFLRLWRYA